MPKGKGVSAEEKRNRLLELFYERKDVLNYKELEKLAHTEKGINAQSLKDVLNALIADNFVETSKIGTSVYYWAFPSEALSGRNKKLENLEHSKRQDEAYVKETTDAVAEIKKAREDTPDRRAALVEYESLLKDKTDISKLLVAYKDSDPDVIEEEKKEIQETVDGVNRWTDNIDCLRSWTKKRFLMSDTEFAAQTGIPEDWEYVDITPTPK